MSFYKLYQSFYREDHRSDIRQNSVAIAGGVLGDEGKGRITEELTSDFLENFPEVIHYRDNGGANAGHTVVWQGEEVHLHQIGSGIFNENCTVVLGKNMVLHPTELTSEIKQVKQILGENSMADLKISRMAALSLDTHRAFETVLKQKKYGEDGSTGRGISPAYADIIYRHPLRVRDLYSTDWQKKLKKHYKLYRDLISGLGADITQIKVKRFDEKILIDSYKRFVQRIYQAKKYLQPFVANTHKLLKQKWEKTSTPFVFEKAQGVGLDKRWGVYPDVTASDCSFSGIYSSSEGIIKPSQIEKKALVVKATYSSSVGSRNMPTEMPEEKAHKIREDAGEYGTTTGRPRDILHIDLPMLSYLAEVSDATHLVLTHMDISYSNIPIKVCVDYKKDGKSVEYRPDQKYLQQVEPEYVETPSWSGEEIKQADNLTEMPKNSKKYMKFISKALGLDMLACTYGPEKGQTISFNP